MQTHRDMHRCTDTHTDVHRHTHKQKQTRAHRHTDMNTQTHTQTRVHTRTCRCTLTCRDTVTHRHTCPDTRHAHTDTHAHRDTHRHTRAEPPPGASPGRPPTERASLPSNAPLPQRPSRADCRGPDGLGASPAHTAPRPGSFLLRAQTQKPQPGRGGATHSHAPRGNAPRKDTGATPSPHPLWDRTPRPCPL